MVVDFSINQNRMKEEDKFIDVICITNIVTHEKKHNYHRVLNKLEIGKIYKCLYNDLRSEDYGHQLHYIAHEDPKVSGHYSHYLFMPLSEWREKQIDSILEN